MKKQYYDECIKWDDDNYNCLKWSGQTIRIPSGYTTRKQTIMTMILITHVLMVKIKIVYYIWQNIKKTRNKTHRDEMISKIKALSSGGSTPTAYAYAEAAAYLMGKSTIVPHKSITNDCYEILLRIRLAMC